MSNPPSDIASFYHTSVDVHNFRCFEDFYTLLKPRVNIFFGKNGSGKSAVLAAVRPILGAILSEFPKEKGIENYFPKDEDIRITPQGESLGDITLDCAASIHGRGATWQIYKKDRTVIKQGKDIIAFSAELNQKRIDNEAIMLPLIAFYSAGTWSKERKDSGIRAEGSRLRGYYNCMADSSTPSFFEEWFQRLSLAELQYKELKKDFPENGVHDMPDVHGLSTVRNAVVQCVENRETVFYDLGRERMTMLMKDGRNLPLEYLSDGVKRMLAIVGDLAQRCALLNPHVGELATTETSGVVLIDELDLHLHPAWQAHILQDLVRVFPRLQFIVTTHSPVILSHFQVNPDKDQIIRLDNEPHPIGNLFGRSVNDTLAMAMDASFQNKEVENKFNTYFSLIENGKGLTAEALALRTELRTLLQGEQHPIFSEADTLLSTYS